MWVCLADRCLLLQTMKLELENLRMGDTNEQLNGSLSVQFQQLVGSYGIVM